MALQESVLQYFKYVAIKDEWIKAINTRDHHKILAFYDKNESTFQSSNSWYLMPLLEANNINALHYVITKTKSIDMDQPFTYCPVPKYRNFTPLAVACCVSGFDVIKLLLSKGADTKSPSNNRIINYLFQHNTCIDAQDITPCVHHLVRCGAKVPRDCIYVLSRYRCPSLEQLEFDIVSLAHFLSKHGADLNYVATALDHGHLELAQFMIDRGAQSDDNMLRYVQKRESLIWLLSHHRIHDIDHNHKHKGTALFHHAQHDHRDAVQVLLSFGANINVKCTFSQMTALEVAIHCDFREIVEMMIRWTVHKKPPVLLQEIQHNAFESLPIDPMKLKQSLNAKRECTVSSECIALEENVNRLLNALKVEYDKLKVVQSKRDEARSAESVIRSELKLWDDFESMWMEWDIHSFMEWMKRIQCRSFQFSAYWKSDRECMRRIDEYIRSNAMRFEIGKKEEDSSIFKLDVINPSLAETASVARKRKKFLDRLQMDSASTPRTAEHEDGDDGDGDDDESVDAKGNVFQGQCLQFVDRYILDKIGIVDAADCDLVHREIVRLRTKYPLKSRRGNGNLDRLCHVCCNRQNSHILQCGHAFCKFCIDEFKKTTNRCAICKTMINLVIKMF